MKNTVLFLALLMGCIQAPANTLGEDPDLGDFDKIRADLVCGDKGGAFHINRKEGLLWQAELNDKEGLPLQVTSFRRNGRCKTCLDIEAQYDLMGQTVYYELKTRLYFEDHKRCMEKKPKTKMEVRLLKDGYGRKELVEKWVWTCR